MGYWIILVLITCGGLLVVVAGSCGPDAPPPGDADRVDRRRSLDRRQNPDSQPRENAHPVPIRIVLPASNATVPDDEPFPSIAGAVVAVRQGLRDASDGSEDSVVVLVQWADNFLSGMDLDEALDAMDRLLDALSEQPALAVVGSIPNMVPGLAAVVGAADTAMIESTVGVWNRALADLAQSYDAEYADLSSVHASVCYGRQPGDGLIASAEFNLHELYQQLEPALHRAVQRVASAREYSW